MVKARVAPSKVTSIPRLELSADVTAVRLSVLLKSELHIKIDEEFFWTAQVVLAYINNVQWIRENTNVNQWLYVDTKKKNPADYASKGLCASDILSSNWLSGPEFLWKEEVYEEFIPTNDLLVGDPEVKAAKVLVIRRNDHA